MSIHVSAHPHARVSRGRTLAILIVLVAGLVAVVLAPVAHASTPARHHATKPAARHAAHAHLTNAELFQQKADKVIAEASRQKGKPYSYGADGPGAFDCSGLVRYVFQHALGKNLPHNAAEQYRVSHHVSRARLRVGDLVFVDNGGDISHVGIFDGHHFWWVAPHTGTHVQRQRIYSAHFLYGRVINWPKGH